MGEGGPIERLKPTPTSKGKAQAPFAYWFDWWRAAGAHKHGDEEAGREPSVEAARCLAELVSRYEAGLLREPLGGLKEAMVAQIRFVPR